MPDVSVGVEGGVAAVVPRRGKGRLALNEPAFGSSAIAGSVEMLRFAVGNRSAEEMRRCEGASITEFVDIWYPDTTWRNLLEIRIH